MLDRLLGHTLVRDREDRLHFLPWGLFSLMTPLARTYQLPDEPAERRVRRLLGSYLLGQFALVVVWIVTSRFFPVGLDLWWALACMLPAPLLYLLGVMRLTRSLSPSSMDAGLRDRLRLVAGAQHPLLIWMNFLLCVGGMGLGVWLLAMDESPLGRLVGFLMTLLLALLAFYQLTLLKVRSESDKAR
jgi:hypothetical protein